MESSDVVVDAVGSHLKVAERRFAEAVFDGLPLGEAYEQAVGRKLKPRSALRMGQKYLKRPLISAYLLLRQLALIASADRMGASSDRTTEEIATLAFSRIDDYQVDWETGEVKPAEGKPDQVMRALSRVKFTRRLEPRGRELPPIVVSTAEITLWNKLQALRMLGEIHGMFTHRGDSNSGNQTGPDLV